MLIIGLNGAHCRCPLCPDSDQFSRYMEMSRCANSGQQAAVAPRSKADQYGETGPMPLAQDFGEETNACS